MKEKMIESGDKSGTSSRETDASESSETDKQQLKNQINRLRALISQIEGNVDVTKFGNVIGKTKSVSTLTLDRRSAKRVLDTNALFRKEFHKYIGFYCAKMSETEYVFKYKPYDETNSGKTYSVQILNKDGKTTLGNWVMPMSIDIDKVLSKTPIDGLPMIIPFLKNWKLYIDCHSQRKSQFQELKAFTSTSSNCTVDANPGFTWINLQLFGAYNKADDSYVDLIIYLAYKQNETRPYDINTQWNLKKCSIDDETELKGYTKILKNRHLLEGFKLMIETNHPVLSWTTEENDNSPLELNNTSDSDQDSILESLTPDRKKLTRKRRKRRESKERSKRTKARTKSQKTQPKLIEDKAQSPNQKQSSLPTKPKASELSPLPRTRNLHRDVKITNDEVVEKPGRKLRQTTISFGTKSSKPANTHDSKFVEPAKQSERAHQADMPVAQKKSRKNINRATTSTPLNQKLTRKVKFAPKNEMEISPIASDDDKYVT